MKLRIINKGNPSEVVGEALSVGEFVKSELLLRLQISELDSDATFYDLNPNDYEIHPEDLPLVQQIQQRQAAQLTQVAVMAQNGFTNPKEDAGDFFAFALAELAGVGGLDIVAQACIIKALNTLCDELGAPQTKAVLDGYGMTALSDKVLSGLASGEYQLMSAIGGQVDAEGVLDSFFATQGKTKAGYEQAAMQMGLTTRSLGVLPPDEGEVVDRLLVGPPPSATERSVKKAKQPKEKPKINDVVPYHTKLIGAGYVYVEDIPQSAEDLIKISGIGQAKAEAILAFLDLSS